MHEGKKSTKSFVANDLLGHALARIPALADLHVAATQLPEARRGLRITRGESILLEARPWRPWTYTQEAIEAGCLHQLALNRDYPTPGAARGTIGLVGRVVAHHLERLPTLLQSTGLDGAPIILLGLDGSAWFHLPGIGSHMLVGVTPAAVPAQPRQLSWTPRQQWVMRALVLAPLARLGWWHAPGDWSHVTAKRLADASSISLSMIVSDIATLVQHRWLSGPSRVHLQTIDPLAMATAQLDYHRLHPSPVIPVRPAGADWEDGGAVTQFVDMRRHHLDQDPVWAITGWHALARQGRSATARLAERPYEIVGDPDRLMQAWRLIPTELGRARMLLRPGIDSDRVGGPLVDGLPMADSILTTAHASADPEGGPEQVAHLIDLLRRAITASGMTS